MKDVKDTYITFSVKVKVSGDYPNPTDEWVRSTFLKDGASFNVLGMKVIDVKTMVDDAKTEKKTDELITRAIGSTILKGARKFLKSGKPQKTRIKLGSTSKWGSGYVTSFAVIDDTPAPWKEDMILMVHMKDKTVQLGLQWVSVGRGYKRNGYSLAERARYKGIGYATTKEILTSRHGREDGITERIPFADPDSPKRLAKEIERLLELLSD